MSVAERAAAAGAEREVSAREERAIVDLIYASARCADDRQYVEWMDLFTEDGQYSAITLENFKAKGLYLFKDKGRRALQERAAYQIGIWQTPRGKTLHLVSNIVVRPGETEDVLHATSNFIMTRTGDMEHSKLHACGRYVDSFERQDGRWLFKSREVILDTNVLPAEFTDLL